MRRTGYNLAKLVFCPFSNREGQWFWDDGELRDPLAASRLYVIAQRKELLFRDVVPVETETGPALHFGLECGEIRLTNLVLSFDQFKSAVGATVIVEGGSKIMRVYERMPNRKKRKLIYWFTPDKLVFQYSRQDIEVKGLEEFRRVLVFKLHYVGISKQHDSFSRLYKTAHKGRTRILSLERPMREGADLSDELTILLFDVERNEVQTFNDADFADEDNPPIPELSAKAAVIADAEKAFVHALRPTYNEKDYPNYPAGSDGLANSGLTSYFFAFTDPLELFTARDKLRGGGFYERDHAKIADMVSVQGGSVEVRHLREELRSTPPPPDCPPESRR